MFDRTVRIYAAAVRAVVARRGGRRLAAALLAATGLAIVAPARPATAVEVGPVRPADPTDGLAWANYYRSFGENLPPVTTNAALSAGPQNVADWLAAYHKAGDPYCNHVGDATHQQAPGVDYTHNVLFCGPASIGQSVEGWVDTPYHGAGFVDPTTTAIGFGFDYDTSAAKFQLGGAPAVSRWPKPDGVLPTPSFPGGESPDPRAPCGFPAADGTPGTAVGRPIFLTVPAAGPFGGASVVGPAGPVAICVLHASPFEAGAPVLDPGEATRQVAILARFPYQRGQSYMATVILNNQTYTWSFLVADVPAAPPVSAAVTGPGLISVSWAPPDPHGLPITGYRVDNLTTGASFPQSPVARSATIGGLTPGATYTFQVVATNDAGTSPAATTVGTAIDLPPPPRITAAVGGDHSGVVSWTAPATPAAPVTSYQFEIDGGQAVDVGTTTTFHLEGLTNGRTYTVGVRAVNAAGTGPWTAATVVAGSPTRLFFGLPAPVRVADTRVQGGPLAAGTSRAIDVVTATGHPAGAVAAVSFNLTATGTTGPGFLTAWPCDQPRPEASNVNFAGGEPGVPNHVIVPIAADGTVCVYSGVSASDVVVDLDGWFAPVAGLVPETPHRALDTRLGAGATTDVKVAVAPAGAAAAVVNLTAASGSGAAGFVTAYPCGATAPTASNLNFTAGQTVADAAVVPVAPDGSLCLHTNTPTNLAVDISGYVTANFVPTGPTRVLDTRASNGPVAAARVTVAPAGAAAGAILTVTAAGGSTRPGYVTVHAADVPAPVTSNVNFAAGQVVPNAAVVRPDGNGVVQLTATTPVDLVVDVDGYFT
jgi:hypothetical protein